MRSLPTIVARAGAVGGLGIVMAGAAWSLPAGDQATIESAGSATIERTVDEPDVVLPELAESARKHVEADNAAERVPATTAPAPEAGPATPTTAPSTTTMPDHLVVDDRDADASATTTIPPATVPPTTAPPTTVAPTPTTAAPAPVASVAFSATQQYGSCGEDVPYDIFSGTAAPGSTVSISSAYGAGSATADADGHWNTKVEFPNAPKNQTFAVDISAPGGSTTLHFTATGDVHHDA